MPNFLWPNAVERDSAWMNAVMLRALPAGIIWWPLDSRYWLPTKEDFELLLEWNWTDHWNYLLDRFDCEDFSLEVKTVFGQIGLNCVGLVIDWSSAHAYNLVIFEDGSFRWLEPQNDTYIELGYGVYKLTNGAVLL